jgi:serine/threonine protein kinase
MAEQEEPVHRRVALKVIKLGMDTRSVIARFEAERQALALMDHPNIAKVLDAGATERGRPYFVMELVRGVRITDYCDQNKLSTRERLSLFTQVCHAIQHAHQKGIIHRDIKPSNILVTVHDDVAVPKVIDFGIAKATSDQRLTDKTLFTAFEQFIGTPAYMSPEQVEMTSGDIDTRSDIYALGVLLYELLTGRTPFEAERLIQAGLEEVRRIIREEEPPKPSTRLYQELVAKLKQDNSGEHRGNSDADLRRRGQLKEQIHLVRGDLDWIAMKCLEKDRTRRYETANGLAADVQRHLNNEPIIARPPSNFYRLRKLVRRHKLGFAGALAASLFLILGTVSYIQAVRQEERKTKNALVEAQTNFRLARDAIQHAMVTIYDTGNRPEEFDNRYALFLGVYRKARAVQPNDHELLVEYVRLLAAKSRKRWNGREYLDPPDAEDNLQEAIALLEAVPMPPGSPTEERFLLAQLYQSRVNLWRERQKLGPTVPLPPQMEQLRARAKSLVDQLLVEKPEEEKFVVFSTETVPLQNRSLSELGKHLTIVENLLQHKADNIAALQQARYVHWRLGEAATNAAEAGQHFRRALDLSARMIQAKGYHPLFRDPSAPEVNSLVIASALLRVSHDVDPDYSVLTNLLASAEVQSSRAGGNFGPTLLNLDQWDGIEREATPGVIGGELVLGLQVKIAYHLMRHGSFGTVLSFVDSRLPKFQSSPRRSFDEVTPYIRDYLQIAGGIVAMRSGRPEEAIQRLEPLASAELSPVFGRSVPNYAGSAVSRSLPRANHLVEMRDVAAGVLDEAYVATGREKDARQSSDAWLAGYDRDARRYGDPAAQSRVFVLSRRAALDLSSETSRTPSPSRLEALEALRRLSHSRLYAIALLAANAAANAQSELRRSWFSEVALAGLSQLADAGLHNPDDLVADPDLRPVTGQPAFRELLPRYRRSYDAVSEKLAADPVIDVTDGLTLTQAAARRTKVRMSGRIASLQSDKETFQIWMVGAARAFSAGGRYEFGVPELMKQKDLADLVGGHLIFNGQPSGVGGPVTVNLSREEQIESFQPQKRVETPNVITAATNVTLDDLGKRLIVEGIVRNVTRASWEMNGLEFHFAGNARNGLIAILPAQQRTAFDRLFPLGPDTLGGAIVRIAGVVEILDGRPRISLPDMRRLEVLTPVTSAQPRPVHETFRREALPARDRQAAANLIDLAPYYNAELTQSWHSGTRGASDLSALPSGLQRFAEVDFDVRGIIQIGGQSRTGPYTNRLVGLRVARTCQRLHFLQAAINSSALVTGTPIGRYVIHYSNGKTNDIPAIIGQQLAHWRKPANEANDPGAALIPGWTQSEQSAAQERKQPARLFKYTWENRLPDVAIESIDLECTHPTAAPFVVAITAEP